MLTESQRLILLSKEIPEKDIRDIEDYDEQRGVVTLKNGDTRTVTEVYSRCMGYFSPRERYNIGKKQEHKDRKLFVEPKELPDVKSN